MSLPNVFKLRLSQVDPDAVTVEHEPMVSSVSDGNSDIPPPSPLGRDDAHNTIEVEASELVMASPRTMFQEQTPPTMLGKALQYTNEHGDTLLHIAVRLDDHGMVHDLLAYGADPFIKNKRGDSPFSMCLWSNNYNTTSRANIRHMIWDHIKMS